MSDNIDKMCFVDLIKKGKIRIPQIQRDYAQGRKNKEVKEIRKRAAEVAEQALWKHFIQYYYEAYDIALRKARIRQLS